jgi:catechol 2,3-dioxygenase-like lactoylglutathione lyase family enzyme
MTMLSVRVGTNDLEKARGFYDATFAALGLGPSSAPPTAPMLMYPMPNGVRFLVGTARNGAPATHANGGTIIFDAQSPEAVDAWHAAGIANGGRSCEDPPGPRPQARGAYGAYLRDPDGNKLGAYCGLFKT